MSKSLKSVLKLALAALCLALLSIGATLYVAAPQVFSGASRTLPEASAVQADVAPPPAVIAAPIFLELEPFTVVLRDALGHRRILYVGVTLHLEDAPSRALFDEYMPEVRDRILGKLSAQDATEVQTPNGRLQLTQDLTRSLQMPYHPQLPAPRIRKVLFTAFVVQ